MRAIIIDDDPYNIELIEIFCTKYAPTIELVGKAESVEEGIEEIIKKEPDILFLDGEIHNQTGFDILDAINMPDLMVVMTTAHEKFGVQAAKARVMDYLLKPISIKEFIAAVEKCSIAFRKKQAPQNNKHINVHYKDHIKIIAIDNILHLKSEGNYTIIVTINEEQHISSKPLSYFEMRLQTTDFIRVHNSHIVSIRAVSKFIKSKTTSLLLINNTIVPVSESRKNDVFNRFQ